MDNHWTFKVFIDAGVNVIDEWLANIPTNIRVRFRTLLAHMAITKNWVRPYFDKLKGYENLYEIRLTGHTQYRLLGGYGPDRKDFTLLIGAIKRGASRGKSATWDPKNTRELADKRCKLILEDGKYSDEYY